MAHRFRKSTGPTRLGKKARASMRWSLEANLVMLGTVAAIAIALSLLLLVLPTSELHAQTNSAPSVSRVSPSSPVSLTTGGSQTFQVSATDLVFSTDTRNRWRHLPPLAASARASPTPSRMTAPTR